MDNNITLPEIIIRLDEPNVVEQSSFTQRAYKFGLEKVVNVLVFSETLDDEHFDGQTILGAMFLRKGKTSSLGKVTLSDEPFCQETYTSLRIKIHDDLS